MRMRNANTDRQIHVVKYSHLWCSSFIAHACWKVYCVKIHNFVRHCSNCLQNLASMTSSPFDLPDQQRYCCCSQWLNSKKSMGTFPSQNPAASCPSDVRGEKCILMHLSSKMLLAATFLTRHRASANTRWRSRSGYVVITTQPVHRPIMHYYVHPVPFPKLRPESCRSVGIRPRTDTQTDTQTRVTTIHFESFTTHAKCN